MVPPPDSYQESRDQFRSYLPLVRRTWPEAVLTAVDHPAGEGLSTDWIRAEATGRPKKLFLLSTGEHGVEGYVGAVMLELFVDEFLSRLNPDDTGLVLVHPINPWGMKHLRRTNDLNVDLNRNFLDDAGSFQAQTNPHYADLDGFLNPDRRVGAYWREKISFLFRLARTRLAVGRETLQGATLLGQYQFPRGIYFGGQETQFETETMVHLYNEVVQPYEQVVHIDIHTGYGPRDEMTMVNSPLEPRPPSTLQREIGYPRVVAADPDLFYSIRGDMMDWFYRMMEEEHPGKEYYGTAFEFGTVGEGFSASIRSLRTMILENQAYWHGVKDEGTAEKLRADYVSLYRPSQPSWVEMAVQDARLALEGILQSTGYIPPLHEIQPPN